MLDVITDFWKPVKKAATQEKPDLDRLQVGSVIGFGFVPQQMLSGRRLKVSAINTYQFGDERMTSFVLSNEKEGAVSMMVLSGDGDQFLSISRRIPFADRMRMFDPAELEAVFEQEDAKSLTPREVDSNWKHWIVPKYKKEVDAVKGSVRPGDFRAQAIPSGLPMQSFEYLPIPSENNEHAIEIEKYADGKLELYATIYRRLSDIGEIEHPQTNDRLSASPVLEVIKSAPTPAMPAAAPMVPVNVFTEQKQETPPTLFSPPPLPAEIPAPFAAEKLAEAVAAPLLVDPPAPKPEIEPELPAQTAPEQAEADEEPETLAYAEEMISDTVEEEAEEDDADDNNFETSINMETSMAINNGVTEAENVLKPKFGASFGQDARAEENEAIECDLKIANKIIEEAIRNEMRLSDVVRRIIALPVSNPESVHIPVMLTESDFQLLAIRYGIPATDRVALKNRIIEELGDFSGSKKQ